MTTDKIITVEELPTWDGVDRITQLARYVMARDQYVWHTVFRTTLVSKMRSYLNKSESSETIYLVGEQATGKSTFIRNLLNRMPRYFWDTIGSSNVSLEIKTEIPIVLIYWGKQKPGEYLEIDIEQLWSQVLHLAHQ